MATGRHEKDCTRITRLEPFISGNRRQFRAVSDHNDLTVSPRHSGESRSPGVFGGRWIPGQARNDHLGASSDAIEIEPALENMTAPIHFCTGNTT